MDVNIQNMLMMTIVMMATTMLVVTLMEVLAALVRIHHLDGMITAIFVNVKMMMMDVYYQTMLMISTVMMKTTMLVVTMMEELAALVIIHHLDGMLTALLVNVLKVCRIRFVSVTKGAVSTNINFMAEKFEF